MKAKKFATQIDETVLKDLRTFSEKTDRSISKIVNEAVKEYISKALVRPEFSKAMNEILDENSELLKRLAK